MDKVLEKIINDVAEQEGVDKREVELILTSPYKLMRSKISKLELHGKTSDEVGDLKTNFTMPALFKLYLNKYKLDKLNKKENG